MYNIYIIYIYIYVYINDIYDICDVPTWASIGGFFGVAKKSNFNFHPKGRLQVSFCEGAWLQPIPDAVFMYGGG